MRNSTIVNNIHLGRVICGRKQSTNEVEFDVGANW